jgi:hypothetical protein
MTFREFLCKINWHKWEFLENVPDYLQPYNLDPKLNWSMWIEKCKHCNKKIMCDDMIK